MPPIPNPTSHLPLGQDGEFVTDDAVVPEGSQPGVVSKAAGAPAPMDAVAAVLDQVDGDAGESDPATEGAAERRPHSHRRKRKKQRPAPAQPAKRQFDFTGAAGPLAILAAVAVGGWLLLRLLRRRRGGEKAAQLPDNSAAPALVARLDLRPGPWPKAPTAPLLLEGVTFAIADLFDVKGEPSRSSGGNGSSPLAASSAPLLAMLQAAGACGIAKAATPELNLGLQGILEDMPANPLAPGRITGGAGGACASAVASGDVDFAVGMDHLAGIRVAAACCGVFAFRASHGLLPLDGVSTVAPSLETPAWTARDASTLIAVGTAAGLPGGLPKGEVVRVLICKDLFLGCDVEMTPGYVALRSAARQWAGEDEVHDVPLCAFLADAMPSLARFHSDEDGSVLDAMVDAAEALQVAEIQESHPERVDNVEKVDEETLAAARQVAAEAKAALRGVGRSGMLAMPMLPGPPPRRDAPEEELHAFEDRTLQLAALAALAGAPQVVIPVPVPGQPPLAVALLGLPKSDMQLLRTAAKLAPLLGPLAAEAARKHGEQIRQQQQQAAAGVSGSGSRAGAGTSSDQPAAPVKQAAAASGRSSAGGGASSHAQECKDRGNAAFKAGDFVGAIEAYSAAVHADPRNPVYYSNRAMAALKVMDYVQAEADCSMAVRLEAPVVSAKTLLRRGTARAALGRIAAARADFKQVVALEPANRQAKEELRNLEGISDNIFGGGVDDLMNGVQLAS